MNQEQGNNEPIKASPTPRSGAQLGINFGHSKLPSFSLGLSRTSSEVQRPPEFKPIFEAIELNRQAPAWSDKISCEFGLSPIIGNVLAARQFSSMHDINDFLHPTLSQLPSPIEKLSGYDRSIELITECTKTANSSVAIACDFDADGTTAGATLKRFFAIAGVQCDTYTPNRFSEGYGLNKRIIDQAYSAGHKLLITVDFGTFNFAEIRYAQDRGMTVIVVDHHLADEDVDCPADALINPGQKKCGFAGNVLSASGLAWYLAAGLRHHYERTRSLRPEIFLEIATIGLIADMVPLLGPSRVLSSYGLKRMSDTPYPGIRAMLDHLRAFHEISTWHVGFGLGPMINASGRLMDASTALTCLTSDDLDVVSAAAAELAKYNDERKLIEREIKDRVILDIIRKGRVPPAIVLADPSYHTGVIGIVAQRMVDEFLRPAVIMGADSLGIYKGSVRGVAGFHVKEALTRCSKYLLKFGGHPSAGGFSIDRKQLSKFNDAFTNEVCRQLGSKFNPLKVKSDTTCQLEDLTEELADQQSLLEPFGIGNPKPLFLIPNVGINQVKTFRGEHLRFTICNGSEKRNAILYRRSDLNQFDSNSKFDIAAYWSRDSRSGKTQVVVRSLRNTT